MLGEDGDDHGGIFASLRFVNGYGIGVDDFVQLRKLIGHGNPVVRDDHDLFFRIHGGDSADVAVEDLFVIVVPHLHDLVHEAEPALSPHELLR